jgi:hypothetical protein
MLNMVLKQKCRFTGVCRIPNSSLWVSPAKKTNIYFTIKNYLWGKVGCYKLVFQNFRFRSPFHRLQVGDLCKSLYVFDCHHHKSRYMYSILTKMSSYHLRKKLSNKKFRIDRKLINTLGDVNYNY